MADVVHVPGIVFSSLNSVSSNVVEEDSENPGKSYTEEQRQQGLSQLEVGKGGNLDTHCKKSHIKYTRLLKSTLMYTNEH